MIFKKNIILLSSFFFCYNAIAMDTLIPSTSTIPKNFLDDLNYTKLRSPFATLSKSINNRPLKNAEDLKENIIVLPSIITAISNIVNNSNTSFINLSSKEIPAGQSDSTFLSDALTDQSAHALLINNPLFDNPTIIIADKNSPLDLLEQELNKKNETTFTKLYTLLRIKDIIIEREITIINNLKYKNVEITNERDEERSAKRFSFLVNLILVPTVLGLIFYICYKK